MQVGIKGEKKFTVTKDQLACNVGSVWYPCLQPR